MDELQDAKVAFYKKLIADGMCKTRPGIKELMDEAINNPTLKVGICTAGTQTGGLHASDRDRCLPRIQREHLGSIVINLYLSVCVLFCSTNSCPTNPALHTPIHHKPQLCNSNERWIFPSC